MTQKQQPLVSIILATRNEEENIRNCLLSLKKQSYPNIEIIVVDFNSTDKTLMISQKYATRTYQISKIKDLNKTKNYRGAQVNFGVEKSKGSIIFFPDADMTFDKDLVGESVNLLKPGQYDALYIPEIIKGNGVLGLVRNFERSFYNSTCIDVVRIIRKDLFVKIGGFDEIHIEFGPDDWDLMNTLKQERPRLTITQNKLYHHEERLDLKTYISKKIHYSPALKAYSDKWGKNNQNVKKQLGFYYRFFGVFTEQGKWKRLLWHPHLTIGMYFLRLFVGSAYFYSMLQ